MKGKKQKLIIPLVIGIALFSFMVGIIISSSLKITPIIRATDKEVSEGAEGSNASPLIDSQIFVKLSEKLMPVTVNISTTKVVKRRGQPILSDIEFPGCCSLVRTGLIRQFFQFNIVYGVCMSNCAGKGNKAPAVGRLAMAS